MSIEKVSFDGMRCTSRSYREDMKADTYIQTDEVGQRTQPRRLKASASMNERLFKGY